jgi:hypothetical protein
MASSEMLRHVPLVSSSEMSDLTRTTRRTIPEDAILCTEIVRRVTTLSNIRTAKSSVTVAVSRVAHADGA